MKQRCIAALAAVGLSLAASVASAEVKPNRLFTDNAVLQRGRPIPVWGEAANGERVTVTFAGQKKTATAKDGKWRVDFDPVEAGGPYEMTIAGKNTIKLKNLAVGEVWLCGGQSNMQFEMREAGDAEAIANSANPKIRCFTIPRWGASEAELKLQGKWLAASPETTGSFTAVGYHFAVDLNKQLDVPIGLISVNYGGTNAEAWMSREALATDPEVLERFEAWMAKNGNFGGGAGGLFGGALRPLAPYAIRGALWYQGESNASRADDYERVLSLLIKEWREIWQQGDFPFLIVQLAAFGNGKNEWPWLREAQLRVARNTPNSALVVTTDVGDKNDVHPKQKKPVGQRLALAARAVAYGEDVEHQGPVLSNVEFEGDRAILTFDHTAGGLKTKGGAVAGFTIAGSDRKFVEAEATIEGNDKVVVRSSKVKQPVAVRFGWADYPEVDLWNGADLPASPFRTDDFPRE